MNSVKIMKQLLEEKLVDYVAMDIKHVISKYSTASGIKSIELDKNKEDTISLLMN